MCDVHFAKETTTDGPAFTSSDPPDSSASLVQRGEHRATAAQPISAVEHLSRADSASTYYVRRPLRQRNHDRWTSSGVQAPSRQLGRPATRTERLLRREAPWNIRLPVTGSRLIMCDVHFAKETTTDGPAFTSSDPPDSSTSLVQRGGQRRVRSQSREDVVSVDVQC